MLSVSHSCPSRTLTGASIPGHGLSAFSVGGLSLALCQVLGADETKAKLLFDVWVRGHWFLIIGSSVILFAALAFYRQRSLLAWYYGQLCLASVDPDVN